MPGIILHLSLRLTNQCVHLLLLVDVLMERVSRIHADLCSVESFAYKWQMSEHVEA